MSWWLILFDATRIASSVNRSVFCPRRVSRVAQKKRLSRLNHGVAAHTAVYSAPCCCCLLRGLSSCWMSDMTRILSAIEHSCPTTRFAEDAYFFLPVARHTTG